MFGALRLRATRPANTRQKARPMKTRTFLAAAALYAAATAHAAPGTIDISSGSATFENTVGIPSGTAFSDVFNFTLLTPVTDFVGSLLTVKLGTKNIDFQSVALSGGSLPGDAAFGKLTGDPFEVWGLSHGALGAGNYTLTLAGTKFGAGAVSYSGTLEVSPVPEPSSYALLLSGLGVVGWVAKRRRPRK